MKYYICEGTPVGTYNATTKARSDAEKILYSQGYEKLFICTKNGVRKNKILKILQLITYIKNKYIWNKELQKIKDGDTVVIQYPIINTSIGIEKVIKKYSKKINIVALIHDMDSLRYAPETQGKMLYKRVVNEDKKILNACNYIIAHNDKMKEELVKLGNKPDKIIVLEIFDYIITDEIQTIQHKKDEPIIIAGNLSKEKAKYLTFLKEMDGVKFNLYGVGYKGKEKNVDYKGAFLPEELLNNLEGSMGLVWDGISKDTCIGGYGHYLKYNNPHKVSMYLTAGIPVVVWEDAAIARFITENNLGYTIKKLDDLSELQRNITEEDYEQKIKDIKKISKKLKTGEFLKEALKKI